MPGRVPISMSHERPPRMTDSPPALSLQLNAADDVVIVDFAGYEAGSRLLNRERRALHDALDGAIANLNLRLGPPNRRRDR